MLLGDQPICESCVHRMARAGGRGDCPVLKRAGSAAYSEFALGYRRDCPNWKLGSAPAKKLEVEQLGLL